MAAVAKGLVILLLYLSKRVCHDLLIFCKVREELSVEITGEGLAILVKL